MKFKHLARTFAPVMIAVLTTAAAGCDGKTSFKIGGEEGKKLADLDMSGPAPDELVMAGPDTIELTQGDKLTITIDGDPDAAAKMRFTLKGTTLGVMREGKVFDAHGGKVAVVHITMPAPKEITMAGSGVITAPALARAAKVTVAGSGDISAQAVGEDSLDLNIAGSGNFRAAGNVKSLDMTIAGSGSAMLDALRADKAEVTIAGSGSTAFTSDGEVDASIMGSGEVRVKGRARCKLTAMGSGRLICESGVVTQTDDEEMSAPGDSSTPAP